MSVKQNNSFSEQKNWPITILREYTKINFVTLSQKPKRKNYRAAYKIREHNQI